MVTYRKLTKIITSSGANNKYKLKVFFLITKRESPKKEENKKEQKPTTKKAIKLQWTQTKNKTKEELDVARPHP